MTRWLLLALLPLVAHATDATLTCSPTLTYTDHSVVPPGTPITFTLYGGLQGQPLTALDANLTACLSVRKSLDPGVHVYTFTQTIGGIESAQGTPVTTTVPGALTPSPPGGITATLSVPVAATTAYTLTKSGDQLVMLPYGTVPAGTACDASQSVLVGGKVYSLIPHLTVTPTGTVRTLAAFALCS